MTGQEAHKETEAERPWNQGLGISFKDLSLVISSDC